ncbi:MULTISPECIES: gas vesicle protein GvpG [unclassified Streptomyces]|uniref:gas vesicle protein GvpG n=1 Tax=unclassified Streptomyces TaxID=2593676 RepID=UPI002E2FFB17|nr:MULTISPECIES: gas vesicle protein GvpG [unclassified Streptomyces]WUC68127.1 gas vesicle protein GvpG [Streptomyces sp. NBC_00539]
MGLLTHLLTLPMAPVRAVTWVAQRVVDQAEQEYYDPAPIWRSLGELEQRLLLGEIDQETFDRQEDELIDRLSEISQYRRPPS